MSNPLAPLIDRIISNPLTFLPARQPEREASEKPAGYIVLNKSQKPLSPPANAANASQLAAATKSDDLVKKHPRSMYEAVQAYTGKKFLTKAEKKAESKKRNLVMAAAATTDEDLGQDLGEELPQELQTTSKRKDSEPSSEYESASEFPEPSDAVESSPSDDETNSAKLSGAESDDDEDDDDFDAEAASAESADEDSEGSDSESVASSSSDSEVDEASPVEFVEPIKAQDLPRDLEKDSTTPPTSPDDAFADAPTKQNRPPTANRPVTQYHGFNEEPSDRGTNSTRIYKSWRELSDKRPLGLVNHGVTCYMNSAVQAMIHVPAMQHYLDDVYKGKYNLVLKPRSVSHVLAELAHKMWGLDESKSTSKSIKYVNPKRLIQRLDDINCMMSEWQQEDSHEYYMSLMSRLQEDLTPKGVKLNESIIYDIFGGLLHQSVTCKNCNHVSNTKQEFYDLSVGLNKKKIANQSALKENDRGITAEESDKPAQPLQKYSIEKAVKEFFASELIKTDKKDPSSGYVCENCKQRTNAIKVSTIDRAPETLTIHLKRFKFNGNSSSKMKQPVSYPKFLDLSQFLSHNEATKYQLTSVVVHEGRSILSGHYVAHCLQPDGTWADYDDEYINKMTEREALKNPSAYFLVYSRLTEKDNKKRGAESMSSKQKRAKR